MKILNSYYQQISITLITLLGFLLRIKNIVTYDFWFDEAYTGILMQIPSAQFVNEVLKDPTPPVYYSILKVWTLLLGTNDFTLRLFSVICSTITITFIYLICKKHFSYNMALISSIIFAINPFFINYAIEARSYSLIGLLFTITLYFYFNKNLKMFLIFALITTFTHYFAGLYIGLLLGFYALNNKLTTQLILTTLCYFLIALAVINYVSQNSAKALNTNWIAKPTITSIFKSSTAYLIGIQTKKAGEDNVSSLNYIQNPIILGALLNILVILFIISPYNQNLNKIVVVKMYLLAVVPQLITVFVYKVTGNNLYVERYLFPSAILQILAIAFIVESFKNNYIKIVSLITYLLVLTQIQTPTYDYGLKIIAQKYNSNQQNIVFTSPINYLAAKYYMNNNKNVKIHNFDEPENTYNTWPFFGNNSYIKNAENAVIVSKYNLVETTKPTPNYKQSSLQYNFVEIMGSYNIYKSNQ